MFFFSEINMLYPFLLKNKYGLLMIEKDHYVYNKRISSANVSNSYKL